MAELRHTLLSPPYGVTLSPGDYTVSDDGTVFDADGRVFCVLGHPEEALCEQDLANGAAVLALPHLSAAVRDAEAFLATFEDAPLHKGFVPLLRQLREAIARMEGRP